MKPKQHEEICDDMFRSKLDAIIYMRHPTVILAGKIDWGHFDQEFGALYSEEGRPGIARRCMVGLNILKHTYSLSDEEVCDRWVENPYFQYFTGETYFQHKMLSVRSSDATGVVFAKNFWFDGAPAPRVAFGNGRYVPGTIIAKLKRRTGSQSYVVPARIDLSKYSQVWVWCEKFNSPIAVADIN